MKKRVVILSAFLTPFRSGAEVKTTSTAISPAVQLMTMATVEPNTDSYPKRRYPSDVRYSHWKGAME